MLHEVLLALSGYPGNIFVEKDGSLEVVPDLPFIHPSEQEILSSLCKLGTFYMKFKAFTTKYGGAPIHPGTEEAHTSDLHGLYLIAFCSGVERVLEPYRQALLTLEREILEDPQLTVFHVQTELMQYKLLFPAIASVIRQVESQRAHGCYILEILHKNSFCGMPEVRSAMEIILYYCHGVLYKQLSAWLLHGLLLDRYSEFFIHQGKVLADAARAGSQGDDDDLGIGGLSGKQLRELMQIAGEEEERKTYVQFALRPEMLPSYIPVRLAEKILFVGESIQMFEHDKDRPAMKRTGSILKNSEDQFAEELHQLSKAPLFNLAAFESVIDRIRKSVAEHLWKLVVEEADLIGHLKLMKDFYLLGRGELYLAFIDCAQSILRGPPTNVTEHDVNAAFLQAARDVLLDDDEVTQFRLSVQTKGKGQKKPSGPIPSGESGWGVLGLSYSVQWPLHILFTEAVLDKYNTMFRFLLSVKRVQLELQHCWALQMEGKHLASEQSDVAKWQLRTHMAFLLDNLQYYLQVDVLETQFSQLVEKIQATRDFENIRLAHDQFLASLLAQSFILMKPLDTGGSYVVSPLYGAQIYIAGTCSDEFKQMVFHCLNEILDQCHNFAMLVSLNPGALNERQLDLMDTIAKDFSRQSNLLFKILSSVRSHQASPYLAQLLLRVDYNKYFSQAGGTLGSYTAPAPPSSSSTTTTV
ncbi:gamma-tubulin complex component 4-like isoform X1 [Branchiostoma floridae]|uniref:Gamma-tubulin complex component n=1 Tax=Branchiostoma floridae TaxID=7739 RepID=A0A9J7MGZ9_BRAFL|nr:gamma-tubulin complex component 4-like isoform X1 [Branchiostoma floridae]